MSDEIIAAAGETAAAALWRTVVLQMCGVGANPQLVWGVGGRKAPRVCVSRRPETPQALIWTCHKQPAASAMQCFPNNGGGVGYVITASSLLWPSYGYLVGRGCVYSTRTARARGGFWMGVPWFSPKSHIGLSFGLLFELRPFFSLRTPRSTLGKGRVGDPV